MASEGTTERGSEAGSGDWGLDPDVLEALAVCRPPLDGADGARRSAGGAPGEGGSTNAVIAVRRLSGGASRLTWSAELGVPDGGGSETLRQVIVQQERPGSAGAALPMASQVRLVEAAAPCGVPVPRVLAEGGEPGRGWAVLECLPGESLARRILDDPEYGAARASMARQAGRTLAGIHRIPTDCATLPAGDPLEQMRALLDLLGEPHPAFELGLRWLAEHRPSESEPVVVHGDFRMGNLLVDSSGITAVLDWELAHLGSGAEDLGWFCARAWRFGSPLRAGGVGPLEELLEGYRDAGGEPPTPEEVTWWEAYGTLRWGLICVLQANTHLKGFHRSVELAAIGRRAAECEEDLLALIDGPSEEEPPSAEDHGAPRGPHDRPTVEELLEAVSEHLGKLRGEMEGSRAFHLRVAGNVVDMVSREVRLAPVLEQRHQARLAELGVADDVELAAGIREGRFDPEHASVHRLVRQAVRDKLAVSKPGYWRGDS